VVVHAECGGIASSWEAKAGRQSLRPALRRRLKKKRKKEKLRQPCDWASHFQCTLFLSEERATVLSLVFTILESVFLLLLYVFISK
jgi:hypothetical protein